MLSTLRRIPFSAAGWLFEWKYDGFRLLVRKTNDSVELLSRPGNLLNRAFPEIVEAVANVDGSFVWDCELTVGAARGTESFDRLRARAVMSVEPRIRAAAARSPARLCAFDILVLGKRDLRGMALRERKPILRQCFDDTPFLLYATGIETVGELVFEQVVAHDFEGMVAKRLDAPYRRGRSSDWLKIKYGGYSRPAALGFR
ncbi:DNA ligase [Caballeronia sp. LP003]|uniref:ATP-dependent DNA ligase n=1 Tax=Caballeronia sp. LP003 TaxID=3038551 RepID=UPI00285B1623|nr:DNA ligase [Caballeronia sp. LP003]MDR5791697.1 DNA ligase [Caballeronia sp. LP003]